MKPFWSIEPLLRWWRMGPIAPFINNGGILVDIGCDNPPLTINYFKDEMEHCFGIDAEIENKEYDNVTLIKKLLNKDIPLPTETATTVTMLAVLEHLKYPQAIANETNRILKPGGTLLLTVPSPMNKPLLELLAKLHIVRPEMIAQHENYFTHMQLREIFTNAGYRSIEISSFQLGLNTFVRAVK